MSEAPSGALLKGEIVDQWDSYWYRVVQTTKGFFRPRTVYYWEAGVPALFTPKLTGFEDTEFEAWSAAKRAALTLKQIEVEKQLNLIEQSKTYRYIEE